jgi:transcriptional regulator
LEPLKKPTLNLMDEIKKPVEIKIEAGKDYRWYEKNDPTALKLMYENEREKHDKLEKEYYG